MNQQTIATLKRYHSAALVDQCAALAASVEQAHAWEMAALQGAQLAMATLHTTPHTTVYVRAMAHAEAERAHAEMAKAERVFNRAWDAMLASSPDVPELEEL